MTISYTWLKDYITTDVAPGEAAKLLTDGGLEIEAIEEVEAVRGGLRGLVVGQVLRCEKHPDADKLSVTTVDVGAEEKLQIVCGAPNVAAGQSVIVATVGTVLYPSDGGEPFKIKRSKIRGVESMGMICAEDEIGVGESHDGIIVLEGEHSVGTPAATVFEVESDTVLEVGLTPNRVDAASHYGVARDLAASLTIHGDRGEIRAELPSVERFKPGGGKVKVRVENPEGAPRYMGVTMSGVEIKPSPEWLQKYLRAIGINPKNNVVDITNFVLHECGQPLHAFDLDMVEGEEIVVRSAHKGEKFTTLDGVERVMESDDLMICDAKKSMCIAGVFGGEHSGVSQSTTRIFIESAYFSPAYVRRSAKRHGLSTDSSWRFERGADPNMAPYALKRCAMLIEELAGGVVDSEVIDIYPVEIKPFEVVVDLDRINRLIGKEIPKAVVMKILSSLEIEVVNQNCSTLELRVPPYRVDIQREADIAEEILRLYGFNNVENPPYIKSVLTSGAKSTTDGVVNKISEMLVSHGFNEIMSNSLTKASYYESLTDYPLSAAVKILNPLSSELSVMRQTLLFNTLEAIALNAARKRNSLKIFEVGNCYRYNSEKEGLAKYSQNQRLAIAITGEIEAKSWSSKGGQSDFYALKSIVEKLFKRLRVNFYEGRLSEGASSDIYCDSESASYTIRGAELFTIGKVRKEHIAQLDIKPLQDVYYLELDLEKLHKIVSTVKIKASELSKFQPVKRDLALLIDSSVSFAELREVALKAEKKLLKEVSIFDVYSGDKLPAGKKSYALSFILDSTEKTLTDKEIEAAMANIGSALEKIGAEVRGS